MHCFDVLAQAWCHRNMFLKPPLVFYISYYSYSSLISIKFMVLNGEKRGTLKKNKGWRSVGEQLLCIFEGSEKCKGVKLCAD